MSVGDGLGFVGSVGLGDGVVASLVGRRRRWVLLTRGWLVELGSWDVGDVGEGVSKGWQGLGVHGRGRGGGRSGVGRSRGHSEGCTVGPCAV